jgi:integrase
MDNDRLKYVKIVPDPRGGAARHYFRFADGKFTRLRGEHDSADYLRHHAELLAQRSQSAPVATSAVIKFKPKPTTKKEDAGSATVVFLIGSVGWVIEQYLASREFRSKAESTQKNYRRLLKLFKASKWGRGRIADLRPRHVREYCREIENELGASRGKAMLAVISNIWNYSLDLAGAKMPDEPNPTIGSRIKYTVRKQRQAWPPDIRTRFLADAPEHLRLMFNLLLYTGQRRSDVQKMKWSDYKAGQIAVFQQKTGEYVPVPVHKDLAEILAPMPRHSEHILTSAWSKHYRSESSISHAIRNRLRAIGVPDGLYSCHGLRTTAGHMLAESGCNEIEIMRILGHKKADQSHYYIREANKAEIASAGMRKWETADEARRHRIGKFSNPQPAIRQWNQKRA